MAKSYYEKLKDPRWQKKRLAILERDGWACRSCNRKDETLHIHHVIYKAKCQPWEYEDDELLTLCEFCHSEVEICISRLRAALAKLKLFDWCPLTLCFERLANMSQDERDDVVCASGYRTPGGASIFAAASKVLMETHRVGFHVGEAFRE